MITIVLDILFWVIFSVGLFFIGYVLYYQVWPKVAWRFRPTAYQRALARRTSEARLKAKQKGKQKFVFNKRDPDQKVIVWATSFRIAQKKYRQLSPKKQRPTELF
jgi:hypothetical protein